MNGGECQGAATGWRRAKRETEGNVVVVKAVLSEGGGDGARQWRSELGLLCVWERWLGLLDPPGGRWRREGLVVLRERQEGDVEEIELGILSGLVVRVEDGGGEVGERRRLEVAIELDGKIKRKKERKRN